MKHVYCSSVVSSMQLIKHQHKLSFDEVVFAFEDKGMVPPIAYPHIQLWFEGTNQPKNYAGHSPEVARADLRYLARNHLLLKLAKIYHKLQKIRLSGLNSCY